jgi:hypothetical protein
MRIRRRCEPRAALVLALLATAAGAAEPDRGLRFDSPQVLDLAAPAPPLPGPPLSITPLSAEDAAAILVRTASDEAPPGLAISGDDDVAERELVAAEASRVARDGKHLRLVPAQGDAVEFVDWVQPATREADGDEETHRYLGRLEGSGYHRVEVRFGHDSPGSFLVNPASGKAAFVHEGSDVVAPSPDGLHLLTFNADNPPLSLRVAALDATGPRLELSCSAPLDDHRAVPGLVGWSDAQSFDLAFLEGDVPRTALRFSRSGEAWSIATSDPAWLAAIGFACRQAE